MKKRVNISIGERLHAQAVEHAKSVEMDFSELVAHLLRTRLGIRVELEPDGAAIEALPLPPSELPSRNAPCPCGSGIKMKRCTCTRFAAHRAAGGSK